VAGLAFTPDGQRLACDLVLRNLAGKELSKGECAKDVPPCMHVAFSPDGQRLASVHFSGGLGQERHAICLWNVTANNKLRLAATLKQPKAQKSAYEESLYYLTFSLDGRMLATREPDDSTVVWETMSGNERLRLDTKGIAVAFAPDASQHNCVSNGTTPSLGCAAGAFFCDTVAFWSNEMIKIRN
jgi:WD40 repeat protein